MMIRADELIPGMCCPDFDGKHVHTVAIDVEKTATVRRVRIGWAEGQAERWAESLFRSIDMINAVETVTAEPALFEMSELVA